MIDGQAPLRHDLLKVPVREGIPQMPADAKQDDRVFEVPPAEQRWPFSDHRSTLPNPLSAFATQPKDLVTEQNASKRIPPTVWLSACRNCSTA